MSSYKPKNGKHKNSITSLSELSDVLYTFSYLDSSVDFILSILLPPKLGLPIQEKKRNGFFLFGKWWILFYAKKPNGNSPTIKFQPGAPDILCEHSKWDSCVRNEKKNGASAKQNNKFII